ncbi:putative DNA ligase 3 [Penaeus vannamei]|uniref:DNA ligase n=1 Tax=Penaeus vannamei TaxID=6689 RepID=A0A3R7MI04_PENVA|nr:putative DNA ligase 3 [Penaeus vannamei]
MDQIILSKTTGETLKMKAQVMTPVLPMLAEACKSVDYAFKKCPSGVMYSEIKYDGERVQVHKKDGKFLYYSRSLKPVMPHKVSHFKEYIPKAFPYGKDLILDAEVLMMDTKSGNPLPFGTLGVHKKSEFQDATVCLFVFDCLHYNGEDLMDKPIADRKKILEENMVEIKNHIMLSEMKKIKRKEDLRDMINRVLKQGLEGLVLKDVNSVYEPGKRHWLKVKKDYLNDGAMADTADLVVLGAWYGTGKKGGMMSVFLMGCYDARIKKWCTVTKVHTGHDDATLARLQTELDMVKISQDSERVPAWLKCTKTMIPDFVAADPKKSPVWEITGAEFTRHQIHTADGISIRFPRVTRERSDKTWEQATDLAYLQELYKKSRECSDLEALTSERTDDDDDNGKKSGDSGSSTPIKVQASSPKVSNVSAAFASPKTLSPDKAKGREKIQRTLSAFVKMDRTKPENEDEIKKEKMEHSGTVLGKRHSDENRDRQPNKKLNKYGASESETHQTLNELPSAGLRHPTKNPLPDIFIGIQVGIPDTVPKVADMKRYIIAYPFMIISV